MKRLLLICTVIGIAFALGGVTVIAFIVKPTQAQYRHPSELAGVAVPVTPQRDNTVPPPQLLPTPPNMGSSFERESNAQSEPRAVVLDADAVRFSEPPQFPSPDVQVAQADHRLWGEPPSVAGAPNRFRPRSTDNQLHDEPLIPEPESFLPPQPTGFEPGGIEKVDLTEGMLFLVHVHRQIENANRSKMNTVRVFDGRRVSLTEFAPQSQLAEMKIYAQAVTVDPDADNLQLSCEGTVVVLANQSMLRGENLKYANRMFSIESTEILTTDAKIESGSATFAFPLGTIAIETIAKQAATELEPAVLPAADQPPVF